MNADQKQISYRRSSAASIGLFWPYRDERRALAARIGSTTAFADIVIGELSDVSTI